jgi:radical SAM protein with 4Fe4S-binding SPASM domain|tara:strand:+ start:1074 stop:2063 length:990 start_codon:yes stop_codon:yes gene_type:complete
MGTRIPLNVPINSNTHKFVNGNLLQACPPEIDVADWDIFLDEMQRADDLIIQDHFVQLDLELNSGCNMACPFCKHGYEDVPDINVDLNHYKNLIADAVRLGARSLKLNYINEPLLRRDLEEVISYAKEIGMLNVYLVTNGTLLIKSRRQKMIDSGITKIFVSIDAATAETYNQQRLDGRFNKVVSNVCALVKERNDQGKQFPLIRVSFLKNQLNIHEVEMFEEFWEDKVDLIAFQKMNEVPDQDTGLVFDSSSLPDRGCSFPFKQLVVDAEGDILPCCTLYGKKLALGHIDSMSLSEAWESDKMKTLQISHQSQAWQENPICAACMAGG